MADGTKTVERLIEALAQDLQQRSQKPQNRQQLLEQLKILGRNPGNSGPIFAKRGLSTIGEAAFDSDSSGAETSEALRCIANALFLSPSARKTCTELGLHFKVSEHLKHASVDDEFLCSRILLLLTYGSQADFSKLLATSQLDKSIIDALGRHAALAENGRTTPTQQTALSETLKLLFNLAHLYQNLTDPLAAALPHVINILLNQQPPAQGPLEPPFNFLLNAMMPFSLETTHEADLFPTADPDRVVNRLIEILDKALETMPESKLDEEAATIITLLRRLYEFAPLQTQKTMQEQILPSEKQRELPLGQSEDVSGRLLRLSTSPSCSQLRDSISSMLFELSGKDARKYVNNVGYGYAAGFLVNHKIPHNAPSPRSTDDTAQTQQGRGNKASEGGGSSSGANEQEEVDFVTGQYLKNQQKVEEGPPMTEDEKLREAERLFVLFERLKKTGVVNVQNPVEAAVQSGRIEELPDD